MHYPFIVHFYIFYMSGIDNSGSAAVVHTKHNELVTQQQLSQTTKGVVWGEGVWVTVGCWKNREGLTALLLRHVDRVELLLLGGERGRVGRNTMETEVRKISVVAKKKVGSWAAVS